jgi:predicted nucleic acid-binding protein
VIFADTTVLSLAFRRRPPQAAEHPAVIRLRAAILAATPVVVPGICVQELLSGVRSAGQVRALERLIAPFPVALASRAHHVAAARIANACRAAGVAASTVDCLIAALTVEHGARLLTTDDDFRRMIPHACVVLEPY